MIRRLVLTAGLFAAAAAPGWADSATMTVNISVESRCAVSPKPSEPQGIAVSCTMSTPYRIDVVSLPALEVGADGAPTPASRNEKVATVTF